MGAKRVDFTIALALSMVVAGYAVVAFVPQASACSQVDVQASGDACGSTLAVSATGNAQGGTNCTASADTCVVVSGTGDASNNATSCGFLVPSCVAISGTGDASNNVTGPHACFDPGCFAVSGGGNATNSAGFRAPCEGVGCIAISGTGGLGTK